MNSRESRHEKKRIKSNFQEENEKKKPPNLHYNLNPKLYNSGEVLTRPPLQQQQQRFEGRFSFGAAAAPPCALASVRPLVVVATHLFLSFFLSFLALFTVGRRSARSGRYQATTK